MILINSFLQFFHRKIIFAGLLIVFSLKFVSLAYASNNFNERTQVVAFEAEAPAFQSNCGKRYIQILYDDSVDYEIACEGIQTAEFFAEKHLSYKRKKPIRILFGDATLLEYQLSGKVKRIANMGIYHPKEKIIVVSPLKSQKEVKYFNEFDITRNILKSVVVHEMIHHIHHLNIKELEWGSSNKIEINPMAYEILSYIAQIEIMDAQEKEMFLSSEEQRNFDYENGTLLKHIFFYRTNPSNFAVNAYRYWKEYPQYAVRIFNGKWTPKHPGNPYEKR